MEDLLIHNQARKFKGREDACAVMKKTFASSLLHGENE
jgi:hypothetical protein